MGSTIRFPTLLGLGFLIIGISLSVVLITRNQILKTQASRSITPKNINIVNITDTSVSVYWRTDQPTTGFIKLGSSSSLDQTFRDDRDLQTPQIHSLHFVTINKLNPDTTYRYKINSGELIYPPGDALLFKTATPINPSNTPPLIGTVLDPALSNAKEVLVTLQIPGAQKLAAVSKISGNFILPLTEIRTENLSGSQNLEASTSAKIIATDFQKSSQVELILPFTDTILPPIILGKDITAVPQQQITPQPTTPPITKDLSRFDLNNDGIINSLDQSIVLKNLGKKFKDKKIDLNDDGKIDQGDLDLISQFITRRVVK